MKSRMVLAVVVVNVIATFITGQALAECKVSATEKRADKGIVCPAYVVLEDANDKDNSNVLAIYYTVNGQDPVAGKDRIYKDPILVNNTTTLKFMGVCKENETEIASMIVRVKTKDLTDEEKKERAFLCRPCGASAKLAAGVIPPAQTTRRATLVAAKAVEDENKARVAGVLEGLQQGLKGHTSDKDTHLNQVADPSGKPRTVPTANIHKAGALTWNGKKWVVEDQQVELALATMDDVGAVDKKAEEAQKEANEAKELAQTMWCHQAWWKGVICYGGLAIGTVGLGFLVADIAGAFDNNHAAPQKNTSVLLGNTK